jgi:hypothetical protein
LKKYIFPFLLITTACFVLNFPLNSFAIDKGGCLTCHRYPGLVRMEKPDNKFILLHIDEKKHLVSPHGKVDCRECHAEVSEVPHTGKIKVECTKKCHVEDKEKIAATDSATLRTYHKDEKFVITSLDDKSSCRVCHPLYPHSNNNKVRALINMHTGYLICEVCHLKSEKLDNITYEWKAPETFEFIGQPYGTHSTREKEETAETEGMVSRMLKIFSSEKDDSAGEQKTEYLISRIAAFSGEKGRKKILMNTTDNKKAEEFKVKEHTLSPGDKEKELQYFHRDIARKEISVACNGCHSADGMLDFRKLGFNEKTTKDLQYMNIKSLVTKYETFIIPNLFGH